jgi:hypothetical protein
MATDKQIAANRLNAQKCCGPTSPEGRANSSQNALKTGLDAKSEVIRTESHADYETLTAEYYARFHPTLPEERCLVDTLIKSEWLGRRYLRADAAVWEQRFDEIKCEAIGRVFRERSDIFARVERRINSAQRNFQSALKQLTAIQAKAPSSPSEHPADPLPLDPNRAATVKESVANPSESPQIPHTDAATKPLTPELVSFLTSAPSPLPRLAAMWSRHFRLRLSEVLLCALAPLRPLREAPSFPVRRSVTHSCTL